MEMKKDSLLKLTALLLSIALVASTYAWWECRKKDERLMENIYHDTLQSRLVLRDMPSFLNASVEYNGSDFWANVYTALQLRRYSEHAFLISKVFSDLHYQTGERKYYLISDAMSRIADFLSIVSNDYYSLPERREKGREIIKENLGTIEQLDGLLKELSKYQKPEDIPQSFAEELWNVSSKLEY
jgi:hypothetical protein